MSTQAELIQRQKLPFPPLLTFQPKRLQRTGALNALLADVFTLYLKTKNFHWHTSGPHFRDYHLLLDEHGDQLFAMTDDLAERIRKLGGTTIRSIGHISRLKRIADNDANFVTPKDMLGKLREDDKWLVLSLRSLHALCDDCGDVATASVLENSSIKRSVESGFSSSAVANGSADVVYQHPPSVYQCA